MRICLISVEIFAWGKYGGFGKATRMLGRELVKRGYEVSALIPRRAGQQGVETLDGITVYGYSPKHPLEMLRIFRDVNADIFHSQEPSFATWLAEILHPREKHLVTFRDTRTFSDWWIELTHYSVSVLQVLSNVLFEDNLLVHRAVRKADGLFAASHLVASKAFKKYHLKREPDFLPTPVVIPELVKKNINPTVCYISRWDRRKRPELLIKLAKDFPRVHFIAVGSSRNPKYDQTIRQQMGELPNLETHGWINQFENDELSKIYSQSWILLNTASREGLPNSFIEACGARCAILSLHNPDNFVSNFGYWAMNDDLAAGISFLLKNDYWREAAAKGYEHVHKLFDIEVSMLHHIGIYTKILHHENDKT